MLILHLFNKYGWLGRVEAVSLSPNFLAAYKQYCLKNVQEFASSSSTVFLRLMCTSDLFKYNS